MNNKISKLRFELVIITLLLFLIGLYLITKSDLTYFYFSKKYLPEYLLNINTSTFYVLIVLILVEAIIIFYKCQGKILNKSYLLIQVITLIFIFSFFVLQGIITKNSVYSLNIKISGTSMYPTLNDEDEVKLTFNKKIKRFDIVVFHVDQETMITTKDNQYFIKRIIGLPGDEITWIDGKLTINGSTIDEPYISTFTNTMNFDGHFSYKEKGEIKYSDIIPSGYVFVMGDNRSRNGNFNASLDSREIGLVPISSILGVI